MDKKVTVLIILYDQCIGNEAKVFSTPGTPNGNLIKHEGDPVDIDNFRSLVGKVIFFTTKICPKTGSAVKTLSVYMSSPGPDHWKAIGRLIGYMKQMELRGVLYVEPESFKSLSLADTLWCFAIHQSFKNPPTVMILHPTLCRVSLQLP